MKESSKRITILTGMHYYICGCCAKAPLKDTSMLTVELAEMHGFHGRNLLSQFSYLFSLQPAFFQISYGYGESMFCVVLP
jgi:hypothetical protein